MTDPTTPSLDPVEDRLRRAFAARAEDMAPGDAAGALPDLGLDGRAAPRRSRWTARPLVAAAIVVVVALAGAGVALVARDGDRDETGRLATVGEQPPSESSMAAVTAPRALVVALQDERNLATTTLIGIEDAIALPVTDTARARSDTDAAVAAFEAFIAASPDGAAYQPGLDALGALGELRRDIDADAGPRDLNNVDAAQEVFDRYAGIVRALLDAQKAFAETIDDPVVRAGATAYGWGLRLNEQTAQLGRVALLAVVSPGAESVGELSRLHTEVQQGLDALLAETTGTPYEEAAVTVVGEIEESGLLEATGAALEGPADISAILAAADLPEGWPAFLGRVEEILAAES
ncbi:MAG TPA: nitrate- and nitrite sensing domain-containing protein [Acidimicrobiales bacterium]|nr:nitrate- and nitrite sensing domain-containing protein [Acidimicrobiales bacterium]